MLRKHLTLVLLALVTALQSSPAPLFALRLGPSGLSPVALPAGNIPVPALVAADFKRDGSLESLQLQDGRLAILSGGRPVWQSPAGWTVVQAAITDLNQDGAPEATLLVWRPFRPWPVDQWLPHGGRIAGFQDAAGDSCQIILVGWRGSAYGELWAGSALAEPVRSFTATDLDGDHIQELVTLEGSYADPHSAPAYALQVWKWNGFGFTVVTSIAGTFYKMVLVQAMDGRNLILVP